MNYLGYMGLGMDEFVSKAIIDTCYTPGMAEYAMAAVDRNILIIPNIQSGGFVYTLVFQMNSMYVISVTLSRKDIEGNLVVRNYKLVHVYRLGYVFSTSTQIITSLIVEARTNSFVQTLKLMCFNKQEVNMPLPTGGFYITVKPMGKQLLVDCCISYEIDKKPSIKYQFWV